MGNLTSIPVLQAAVMLSLAAALPEDWKPRRVVEFQGSNPIFTGEGTNGEFRELLDLQEVKLIRDEWAIITGRNNIFVLDLKEIEATDPEINYNQVVKWDPDNSTTCTSMTSDHSRCNNYIRINTAISENLFLMCGTNARAPKCREYEWSGKNFTDYKEGQKCTQSKYCLLDDVPSLAYRYAGGNLYMATRVGHRRSPILRRAPIDEKLADADFGLPLKASDGTTVTKDNTLPHLATDFNDATMLNDPEFISAIDTTDKVLVFFKETAMEQFGNGKVTFSRVAQVCKNDQGGSKNFRNHKWTSYFKARLNCSVPGGKPFNFNELRHVTQPYVIQGVTTVFAVMTTPENSIWGSAVCAYTVPEIERAMNGDFMKRTSSDATSVCWSKYGQKAHSVDPHPSACLSNGEHTYTMSPEKLKFRQHHPLLKGSVQPVTDQPLFMTTQARYIFTAIDADVDAALDENGRNVTVLYIGTNSGHLLKVVPRAFNVEDRYSKREEGIFAEESKIYDAGKCDRRVVPTGRRPSDSNQDEKQQKEKENLAKVISVTAVKGRNVVLVAFHNCVIAVPKYLCANYTCRKECVQSGNPYCGWMHDTCVPVTDNNRGQIERDIFSANTKLPDCASDIETAATLDPFVQRNECMSANSLAAPIAISLSACFIVVLVIFFIARRCKKGAYERKQPIKGHASSLQRDNSYLERDDSWNEASRRPIYKGPRKNNVNTSSSASLHGSRPGSFSGRPSSVPRIGESRESGNAEIAPRCGFPSMDSIDRSSSLSSSSSVRASDSTEHRRSKGVHVVEDIQASGISRPGGMEDADPNLNNNNINKNIGIAYVLSRAETPVRRRSVPSREEGENAGNNIRMGITWGASAGGSQQRQPPCWKSNSLKNPNIISVSPLPTQPYQTSNHAEKSSTECRRSDGRLPKPPASGLTGGMPPKSPKIVSDYNEIENAENHTFRRGRSLNEPYYSEPAAEPDYENLKFQRKASVPGNFTGIPPTPPPPNAKPGRKFSSFTASHFNTSWFPASALQEAPQNFSVSGNSGADSSTSGVVSSTSSISVSDAQNIMAESTYLEPKMMTMTLGRKNGVNAPQNKGKRYRPSVRSTDDGYGSEFVSNERKRNPSNGSTEANKHIYNDIPSGDGNYFPILNGLTGFPAGENLIEEHSAVQCNRQDSKMRTSKKKKSSKKKKNVDKRFVVPELSSPSDNEDSGSLMRDYNIGDDVYGVYCDVGGMRQGGQTLDDSFVECAAKAAENTQDPYNGNQYAFHTMRPPGRMRQKLPRLRHGRLGSDATLKAVPTPEIPKT